MPPLTHRIFDLHVQLCIIIRLIIVDLLNRLQGAARKGMVQVLVDRRSGTAMP
jgi:hypothetical protein